MKRLQSLWPVVLICSATAVAESQPPLELVEPGFGPGYGQSYGPGYGQNYGPGYGSGFGSGGRPAYGPGSGQGYGPGYGQNYGPGYGQNYDPGYGSGFGSGGRPAYGPGSGQDYGPGYGQDYGSDSDQNYNPGYGQYYGPGYGQNYGPGYDRNYNYGPGYGSGFGQGGRPGYGPGYGQHPTPQFEGTDQYQGLRITRESRENGYIVTIEQSRQGGSLEVTPRRGGLVVMSRYSSGTDRPGSGFSRSWGSTSRNIQLPRDADLARMKREEVENRIILTIPRYQVQQ